MEGILKILNEIIKTDSNIQGTLNDLLVMVYQLQMRQILLMDSIMSL